MAAYRRKLEWFWQRVYADFLMPSRLGEFERLLRTALANEYEILSVQSFFNLARRGQIRGKLMINRHDIDSDLKTAKRMFEIEKRLGVCASYYFRLSTIDIPFMQKLNCYGSEASYHFEEIATYAKRFCIKNKTDIVQNMPTIQAQFKNNVLGIRKQTNLSLSTVASHGDFVNRLLQIKNWELLTPELRAELGIILEVYDPEMNEYVISRYADRQYPLLFHPLSPYDAIDRGDQVILILTHSRNWDSNSISNLKEEYKRAWESMRYTYRRSRSVAAKNKV